MNTTPSLYNLISNTLITSYKLSRMDKSMPTKIVKYSAMHLVYTYSLMGKIHDIHNGVISKKLLDYIFIKYVHNVDFPKERSKIKLCYTDHINIYTKKAQKLLLKHTCFSARYEVPHVAHNESNLAYLFLEHEMVHKILNVNFDLEGDAMVVVYMHKKYPANPLWRDFYTIYQSRFFPANIRQRLEIFEQKVTSSFGSLELELEKNISNLIS